MLTLMNCCIMQHFIWVLIVYQSIHFGVSGLEKVNLKKQTEKKNLMKNNRKMTFVYQIKIFYSEQPERPRLNCSSGSMISTIQTIYIRLSCS